MSRLKRDQVWQRPFYKRELHRVRAQNNPVLEKGKDPHSQLQTFLGIINDISTLDLTRPAVKELQLKAAKILEYADVKPGSQLDIALVDLHKACAIALKKCHPWGAAVHLAFAADLATPNSREAFLGGQFSDLLTENMNHDKLAWCDLLNQNEKNLNDFQRLQATVQILLLSGNILELKALMEDLPSPDNRSLTQDHYTYWMKWQNCRIKAVLNDDLQPMLNACQQNSLNSQTDLLELLLWSCSLKKRTWINKVVFLVKSHKSAKAKKFPDQSETTTRLLKAFAGIYDSTTSVYQRSLELTDVVDDALNGPNALGNPLLRYLMVNASSRWFLRTKQNTLAAFFSCHSMALGKIYSADTADNPLGIMIQKETIEYQASDPTNQQSSVSTGVSRALKMGSLSLYLLRKLGWKNFKRILSRTKTDKRFSENELQEMVSVICGYLGRFKGPILKFVQIAATYELPAPDRDVSLLDQLSDSNMAMDFREVQPVVEKAFGKPLNHIFASFDPDPIGVGSIGQVHSARLLTGECVAVKVRYPGIETAISFDLHVLSTLRPLIAAIRPNLSFTQIIDELRDRFLLECDFRHEAKMQSDFFDRLSGHAILRVPKVWLDFCNPEVMVSELVYGQRFDAFLCHGTQDARDLAGQAIVEHVVSSCRDGLFNADPNPGNFLFKDGKVYLVDFGAVKKWTTDQQAVWCDLIRAGVCKDKSLYIRTIRKMGIVTDDRKFDFDEAYRTMIDEGMMGFVAEDRIAPLPLSLIRSDLAKMISRTSRNSRVRDFPPAFVMGFRVYFGHMALVAQLGSRANWSQIVKRVMF